jgi:hypothetical protein
MRLAGLIAQDFDVGPEEVYDRWQGLEKSFLGRERSRE